MSQKIKFECANCRATGTVNSPLGVEPGGPSMYLFTPTIQTDIPCPKCGTHLSWPGGEFKADKHGVVYRAGDGAEMLAQALGTKGNA